MGNAMIQNRRLEQTADGSSTIYVPELDEHYHSVKGALTESMHVFVGSGLRRCAKAAVRVFEVGYGTGLNAALTALNADGRRVDYYSVERYPLSAADAVAYADTLGDPTVADMLRRLNSAPWDGAVSVDELFTLHKIEGDLATVSLPDDIDVVYFDAFAPEKQPEMWDEGVFSRLHEAMADGAVLTTYCAKGVVRRRLQAVGFTVERLPGPPGGKREILRATK